MVTVGCSDFVFLLSDCFVAEAFKYYYYDAEDTNCENDSVEPYVENEMYGDLENGLQIGYSFVHDITSFEMMCTDIDAPFSFAPFHASDNGTVYYATEMLYPEVEGAEDHCADNETDVFSSYMENRCFHYTRYMMVEGFEGLQPVDFSGKYVPDWSPSENIRWKRYVGGSCSDWLNDPILENVKIIDTCDALRGQDSSVVATAAAFSDVRISGVTHTPLESKVTHAYVKQRAAVAKKAAAAAKTSTSDKEVQEDFSSTYSYGYYAIYIDDSIRTELDTRGAYSQWVNTPEFPAPTAVPTVMPTAPTFRPTPGEGEPTAAPTVMEAWKFSAWMTLTNIDQDLWYAKDSNTQSFIQAVAANMHQMDPNDIKFGKVKNVHTTTTSRKLRALQEDESTSGDFVNEVLINFDVKFILATLPGAYANITEAYDDLTSELYEGVIHTGLFDALLQSYSADNGGSLDNVKSVDVGFGEPETYDPTPEEHPKSTHSGLIVGIIIGLGVGLTCIGAMFYWVFYGSG